MSADGFKRPDVVRPVSYSALDDWRRRDARRRGVCPSCGVAESIGHAADCEAVARDRAELEHAAAAAQDAPDRCETCGRVSADVLLGSCRACFEGAA